MGGWKLTVMLKKFAIVLIASTIIMHHDDFVLTALSLHVTTFAIDNITTSYVVMFTTYLLKHTIIMN